MEEDYNRGKAWGSAPYTSLRDATTFNLTLVSVNNLQCERRIGTEISVYAKVKLGNSPVKKTDPYVVADGKNLKLDFPMNYPITNEAGGNLVVRLYYKRSLGLRNSIGEVNIPLSTLFDNWHLRDSHEKTQTIQLAKGDLHIAYTFELARN